MKVLVACEMSGRVTDALLPYFAEAMAAQCSEILRR